MSVTMDSSRENLLKLRTVIDHSKFTHKRFAAILLYKYICIMEDSAQKIINTKMWRREFFSREDSVKCYYSFTLN